MKEKTQVNSEEIGISSIEIPLFGKVWRINFELKKSNDNDLPNNFGAVNERLFRGSWPQEFEFINKMQIDEIITLFSSDDPIEKEWVVDLSRRTAELGIKHRVFDIQRLSDFWDAATYIQEEHGTKYVHCRAGANRTSMVCLIVTILENSDIDINQVILSKYIGQAIGHGLDYDKKKYRRRLENILKEAQKRSLISNYFFD